MTKTKFLFILIVLVIVAAIKTESSNQQAKDKFHEIYERIHGKIEARIVKFSKSLNLGNKLSDRFKEFHQRLEVVSKNQSLVHHCFESSLGGVEFNIFNSSLSLEQIAKFYYGVFNHKKVTRKSLKSLVNTVRELLHRCLDGANFGAKFGFTSLSDLSHEEFGKLNGALEPGSHAQKKQMRFKRSGYSDERRVCKPRIKVPSKFDWRIRGVVTPVKSQKNCGSCWAFAATAVLESAYLINHSQKMKNSGKTFDLSEQQLVNCAKSNGCKGGKAEQSFRFIKNNGQMLEEELIYRGEVTHCPSHKRTSKVRIFDFCVRYGTVYGGPRDISNMQIKQALVNFGPLWVTIDANLIAHYRGGIFNDPKCRKRINHAVTLVGYTDKAWIIKNSWGEKWGEKGYLRLAIGDNICGVSTYIAFPILNNRSGQKYG